MEEEVERQQEPAAIDASKGTTLSRHNRADAHISLQRLSQHKDLPWCRLDKNLILDK